MIYKSKKYLSFTITNIRRKKKCEKSGGERRGIVSKRKRRRRHPTCSAFQPPATAIATPLGHISAKKYEDALYERMTGTANSNNLDK